MKKNILHTLLVCLFAFLGGVASEQFLRPVASYASADLTGIDVLKQEAGSGNSTVKVFYDDKGQRRIDLDASRGHPLQNFYGSDGKLRLQLGTYATGADAGLPLVSLSDNSGQMRALLRLASGTNQSPVLVMRDKQGRDKIILGISANGEEDSFLVYYDKYNIKHTLFGSN